MKHAELRFGELMVQVFSEWLLYGGVSGRCSFGLVQEGDRADVDVFVVLDDSVLKSTAAFRQRWRAFVEGYRDIHVNCRLVPDCGFPGDFMTAAQVVDLVAGRGFSERNGRLFIPPMRGIEDENTENDYRIFRSMFIAGRPLCGNFAMFSEARRSCVSVLVRYLLYEIGPRGLDLQELLGSLKKGREKEWYGFDERYEPALTAQLGPAFQKELKELVNTGYIRERERRYRATENLNGWARAILNRRWQAVSLMDFQDPFYLSARKEIFAGVHAESHWDKLK